MAPDLVPAAVTAAQALFKLGDLKRGTKILEAAWKKEPHPEIADAHVHARPGDSTHDRLARAKKACRLAAQPCGKRAGRGPGRLPRRGEYTEARKSIEAALRQEPREGIFLLLADIEEAETGEQGRVREWLARAVRAPRDPAWVADGFVSEKWAPASPGDAAVWTRSNGARRSKGWGASWRPASRTCRRSRRCHPPRRHRHGLPRWQMCQRRIASAAPAEPVSEDPRPVDDPGGRCRARPRTPRPMTNGMEAGRGEADGASLRLMGRRTRPSRMKKPAPVPKFGKPAAKGRTARGHPFRTIPASTPERGRRSRKRAASSCSDRAGT